MRKLPVLFLLGVLLQLQVAAQTDNQQQLLKEREELIKEYNYLNAQNSNFWGKKSKKDLLKIIDNLKAIIKKDSEIINTIQAGFVKKQAELTVKTEKLENEVRSDQRLINDNLFELKQQLGNLQTRDKARLKKISDLEAQLAETRENKYANDKIIAGMALLSALLLGYTIYLRNQRKTSRRAR